MAYAVVMNSPPSSHLSFNPMELIEPSSPSSSSSASSTTSTTHKRQRSSSNPVSAHTDAMDNTTAKRICNPLEQTPTDSALPNRRKSRAAETSAAAAAVAAPMWVKKEVKLYERPEAIEDHGLWSHHYALWLRGAI